MTNDFQFQLYRDMALSLNCQKYKGHIIPAKPLVLISICNAIALGLVKNNRIPIEIIENQYRSLQAKYNVGTPFNYPLYFLETEPFYHLRWKDGKIQTKAPSSAMLRKNVDYAYLDNVLWDMLQDSETCTKYRESIENYYWN